MNKQQADKEAKKILEESAKKSKAIIEKSKADGTWKPGLDANKILFDELHKETKEKLKLLKSMIDE